MKRLAVSAAVLAGVVIAAWSQETEPLIKIDVDLVSILFSARDKRGALVPDLTKDDFVVLEDGKQQTIRTFTKETDLPLTIGLLIDVSRRIAAGRMGVPVKATTRAKITAATFPLSC